MRDFTIISLLVGCFIFFTSCNKNDYLIGGTLHDPVVNMSTYDYLKSNRFGLFDTLLLLIDKAGIKETINQKGTFFAPTDYALHRYLEKRSLVSQSMNPNNVWTIDSIIKYELADFATTMNMYLIKDVLLPNAVLLPKGAIYNNLKNEEIVVSYEDTTNPDFGFTNLSSVRPKIVYFTRLYQSLPANFNVQEIVLPVGERTLVQTSNIQTNTGTLHVLENTHVLFYFK